jgi:hypothetical protein
MDVLSTVIGAAGVAGAIALYFVATKGAPAVLAWIKTKWNAGAAELVTLRGDVASAHAMIANLETKVQAELELLKGQLAGVVGPVSALQTDVNALKAHVGIVTPPAVAPVASAAPAAGA